PLPARLPRYGFSLASLPPLCALFDLQRRSAVPVFNRAQQPGNQLVSSANQVQSFMLVLLEKVSQSYFQFIAPRVFHDCLRVHSQAKLSSAEPKPSVPGGVLGPEFRLQFLADALGQRWTAASSRNRNLKIAAADQCRSVKITI